MIKEPEENCVTGITRHAYRESSLHSDTLREVEHSLEFEPTVFEVGEYLQRPDDDGSGDRPLGAPQHDLGTDLGCLAPISSR